jgi:hypothetical protein
MRLVIADDSAVIRSCLACYLSVIRGIEVVGETCLQIIPIPDIEI